MYDTRSQTPALCFPFSGGTSAGAGGKGWQGSWLPARPAGNPFEGPSRRLEATHLQIEDLLVAQGADVGEVEGGRGAEVARLEGRQGAGGQVGRAAAPLLLLPHARAAEALLAVVEAAEGGGGGRAELCVRCRLFGVVELVSDFILLLARWRPQAVAGHEVRLVLAGEIRDIFPLVACTAAMQDRTGISFRMGAGVRVAGEGPPRRPVPLLGEGGCRLVLQLAGSAEGALVARPRHRGGRGMGPAGEEAVLAGLLPLRGVALRGGGSVLLAVLVKAPYGGGGSRGGGTRLVETDHHGLLARGRSHDASKGAHDDGIGGLGLDGPQAGPRRG